MIRLLGSRVLVRPEVEEDVTESGIHVARSHTKTPDRGEVLAVGDEVSVVTAGDVVVYPKSGGAWIEQDDEKLLVLRESDVIGVVGE